MTSPSAMTRFTSDELIILSGRDICRTEWAVKRIDVDAPFGFGWRDVPVGFGHLSSVGSNDLWFSV